jgi:uncharacterized membrane protein
MTFLDQVNRDAIVRAIGDAEQCTSGEIRVHVQKTIRGADVRSVAERTFERLGMTKTELRNGVLLFIAADDHKFTILGDRGIDEKVPPGFWDEIAAKLTIHFRNGEFTTGIVEAVQSAGQQLAQFFPRAVHDVNELPNEIDVHED